MQAPAYSKMFTEEKVAVDAEDAVPSWTSHDAFFFFF